MNARDVEMAVLAEIKRAHEKHVQEQRLFDGLCQRAIDGEPASFVFRSPQGDYRIRLIAEPEGLDEVAQ